MAGFTDSDSIITEINITPFVDVLLVLLILFMVTAPAMTRSVGVNLPKDKLLEDKSPVKQTESLNTSLVLGLSMKGQVIYEKKKFQLNHFFERFDLLVAGRKIEKVYIQADRSVSYENLLKLMVFLKNKGHESIGLVFEQK
jgi:biopolymer transport protein TolR